MNAVMPLQLPVPPPDGGDGDQCRLWVGNLDHRLTEFSLLKILQRFGNLQKFDLMYHKSGPEQGKHRGYCFATYQSKEEADYARRRLDTKTVLSKKLSVKLAHSDKEAEVPQLQGPNYQRFDLPSSEKALKVDVKLSNIDSNSGLSRESKIQAIEAKLRAMDETQKDFTYSLKPAAAPGTSRWYSTQSQPSRSKLPSSKPYRRNNSRR